MNRLALLIIATGVLLNSLPLIVGLAMKPTGSMYLGTIHYPSDYFYYLSQFAQGRTRWLWSQDLFTSEFTRPTLVGWINVTLGHLGTLFGLTHLTTYHVTVVALTGALLFLSYVCMKKILPKNAVGQFIALALFTLSAPFPGSIQPHRPWPIMPVDYWFNLGNPLNRFGGVPHQLVNTIAIVTSILATVYWLTNTLTWHKKVFFLLLLTTSGVILASTNPVQWLIVIATIGTSTVVTSFALKKPLNTLSLGIAALLFFAGLPIAWYLKALFRVPPYSQLADWEASRTLSVSVFDFLIAGGPVLLSAVLGFVGLVKTLRIEKLLILSYALITTVLFFSPIPALFHLGNVRFLSPVTFLAYAIIGGNFFSMARGKLHRASLVVLIGVILLSLTTLPALVNERVSFDTNNAFFYLRRDVVTFFLRVEANTNANDTILAIWPFHMSLPGLIGRRVFHGHPLLTIDAQEKDRIAAAFFDGKLTDMQMRELIKTFHISYVLAYTWTPKLANIPELERVIDSPYLVLYRVENRLGP